MTFQQGAQRAPISHPQVLEIGAICPSNHQFLLLSKRKRIIRFTIRGQIDPDKIIMVCGCALWARFTMGNIWPPGTKAYQQQGLLVWVPPSTIRGHLLVWVLKVLGPPSTRASYYQGSCYSRVRAYWNHGLLVPAAILFHVQWENLWNFRGFHFYFSKISQLFFAPFSKPC